MKHSIAEGKMVNTWCNYYIYGKLASELAINYEAVNNSVKIVK